MEQKHSIAGKLVSNTFFISLEWIAVTILSLFFWLVIGKMLSPSDYGVISVFVNFTVIIAILIPLGTSVALFKLIPEYTKRNELGKITSSIRFTVRLVLVMAITSSFLILIFSDLISTSLKLSKELVYLLPFSIVFFSMLTHQGQIILGFQNARFSAITSSIGQGLRTLLSAVLIILQMKFIGPIIAFVSGSIITFLLRIKFLNYNHKPEDIDGGELVMKFGIPSFLAKITNLLLLSGGTLILALFQSQDVVGIFGLAMLLTSQLSVIPNIFSSALFPITSLLSTDSDSHKRQAHLIKLIFRYSLLITLPLLIFVTLFSGKLIVLLSQASYLPATQLIPILGLGALFLGISYIFTNSLYAIGKPDIQRNLIVTTAVIYLLLAFPLSYYFSSLGIAVTYTISAYVLFALSFIYLKNTLRFSIPWTSTGKLVSANIISFGILYILSNYAPNIWIGILFTMATGILYLIMLLLLRFYTKDDINLINRLSAHLPFGKSQARLAVGIIAKFSEG